MNQIKASNYALYARKSSEDDERQVLSIDSQVEDWTGRSKREHINMLDVLSESKSAKVSKTRPVFNQLIEDIRAGKYDGILAWLPDRLSRNAGDAAALVDLMDAGLLKEIRTSNQVFRADSPNDKFMFTLMCSQAKLENDNRGINVRRGLRMKRDMGIPSGVAPLGFVNAGKTRGTNYWEPDEGNPNRFLLMQKSLKLVLDGVEPAEALRILNDQWGFRSLKRRKLGGRPVSKNSWYTFLRNPIICGHFVFDVKWYKVTHPKFKAMLTEDEFWRLQALLGVKGRTRPKLHDKDQAAYLKALTCGECGDMMSRDRKRYIRCLCGTRYYAQHKVICPNCGKHESLVPDNKKQSYDFYFCPTASRSKKKRCSQPKMDTSDIEQQIADVLDSITIPQPFVELAMEYLENTNDEELKTQEVTLESLQHAYDAKQKELNRLSRAFVGGSYEYEGGEEFYQEENRRLIAEKNKLKKSIDEFDVMADDWRGKTEQGYLYCKEALAAFTEPDADYRTKREILLSLCSKATVKGKKLIIELETPFEFIRQKLNEVKAEYNVTEPEKIAELLDEKADKAIADAVKSTWQGW